MVETTRVAFPSGRPADEVCVTNLATVAWCAQMGTIVFHPWPTRSRDNDHPDELRIDLDPQPGTTFTDAVRVAGVARELLEELGSYFQGEVEYDLFRQAPRLEPILIGVLGGVVLVLATLPLAWLGDRFKRTRVVGFASVMWAGFAPLSRMW